MTYITRNRKGAVTVQQYRVVRINGETFVSAEDATTEPIIMKVSERFVRAYARELF
jgi:hypothetical protein